MVGSHPATAQWMQRPFGTKCWFNDQSPTKNIRVPKYWLTRLALTLTLMLATVQDHSKPTATVFRHEGWLTWLYELNPDESNSDESGRQFRVTTDVNQTDVSQGVSRKSYNSKKLRKSSQDRYMPDNVLIRCFFENNGGSEKTLKKSDSLARTERNGW